MLEYDRINISEEIDINKTNASKECDICHYSYFKDIGFKYELYLCNSCHGLMQKAMNFNDVTIVSVKGCNYRIRSWYMNKDDAINIMNNSDRNAKSGLLYIFFYYLKKNEWVHSVETTYYQRIRDVILKRAKDYYKNDKEILRDNTRDKYRNLSEEEKNVKREYGRNRYHNMSEEKK